MDREERQRLERQAVEEAGGGESEGFELAEQELIQNASHGDDHGTTRILRDAGHTAEDRPPSDALYGESDSENPPDT